MRVRASPETYEPPTTRSRTRNRAAGASAEARTEAPAEVQESQEAPSGTKATTGAKKRQKRQEPATGGQSKKGEPPAKRERDRVQPVKTAGKSTKETSKSKTSQKKPFVEPKGRKKPTQLKSKPEVTKKAVTKASRVSRWVDQTQSTRSVRAQARRPSDTPELGSASSQLESGDLVDSSSPLPTEMTGKQRESPEKSVVTQGRLRSRGVESKITERKQDKNVISNTLHKLICSNIRLGDRRDPETVLHQLTQGIRVHLETANLETYTLLENLVKEIDQRKFEIRYPFPHSEYFKSQLAKCETRNEGVFQRTIMMSIFHPFFLPPKFDWNAEAKWPIDKHAEKFRYKKGGISQPKPDLLFAFARDEFIGPGLSWTHVPEDLEKAMSPDGEDRVFPFLFVEVKGSEESLKKAHLSNLNNAAQALNNIRRWFKRAQKIEERRNRRRKYLVAVKDWEKEFHEIRIFTFAFNPSELVVRIHRAEIIDNDAIYRSAEFYSSKAYDRDELCNLFNNILYKYAAQNLFKSLKRVYKAVTGAHNLNMAHHESDVDGHGDRGGEEVEEEGWDEEDEEEEDGTNNANADDDNEAISFTSQEIGQFSQNPQTSQRVEEPEASQRPRDLEGKRKDSPDSTDEAGPSKKQRNTREEKADKPKSAQRGRGTGKGKGRAA